MIKIGELSEITGVSIQTIRYYEAEGLISPIEVDRWTNYRYYDERSIERMSQILFLKDLGFSLKEIKNLNEEVINKKISEIKVNINKLTKSINKLSSIRNKKGEIVMKNFINDERVIGKWKKLAVVKNKEDFALNLFDDEEIFDFKEIYFLPNGEEYWVFSWTKGTLYLIDRELPYEIKDGKLFIGVVDFETNKVDNYAVYEKVDDKKYVREEIMIKDNINVPFINDERVIGFWESVDCVKDFADFIPGKKNWNGDLFLKQYIFEPNGNLIVKFAERDSILQNKWSKNCVINEYNETVSEYVITNIENEDYMCVEWKSGDYSFGGKVEVYYILKKIK